MIRKTLTKLIDYSIFPAILIIAVKLLSIMFLLNYFDTSYSVDGLRLIINNLEDFIAVNSYSSLLMLAAVTSGLFWILIKAHIFHDTHISPSLTTKLYHMDLEELIDNTKNIYSQSVIWLSYIWLVSLMIGVQSYFGLSYKWIFYLSISLSFILTLLLAIDLEKEITEDKKVYFKAFKARFSKSSS